MCTKQIEYQFFPLRGGYTFQPTQAKFSINFGVGNEHIYYSGDLKSDHLKSGNIWNPDFLKVGFQMVRFSNGRALAINHSKSGRFCPDFKWFLTKWRPFVRISNGWASGFQIPFEIQTICNPTCFGPFEIQTRSDFRSPLYLHSSVVPNDVFSVIFFK